MHITHQLPVTGVCWCVCRQDFHTFTCRRSCRTKQPPDPVVAFPVFERPRPLFYRTTGKQSAVTHFPLPVPYTEWEVETAEREKPEHLKQQTDDKYCPKTGSVLF